MKKKTLQILLILLGLAGLIYLGLSLGRAAQGQNPPTATLPSTATSIPASPTPEPQAILDDLRVRQAIAYCTDRSALIRAVYPWLEETKPFEMDSFLPSNHPFYAGNDPEFQRYPYDPEKGRALLESAGWKLPAGAEVRVNAEGEELHLTLVAWESVFRETWISVVVNQTKVCGLQLGIELTKHISTEQRAPYELPDFELAAYSSSFVTNHGLRWRYGCENIPSSEYHYSRANYSGWCNPIVEQAISKAESETRKAHSDAFRTIQLEYARDLPGLSLFQRMDVSATRMEVLNFKPSPTPWLVYTWNAAEWEIPGKDVIVIGERSEPAGLNPLDDSWIGDTVHALIDGMDYVQYNFDYQSITLKRFPTLENGGALYKVIPTQGGEQVYDKHGNLVKLALGVHVFDSQGKDTLFVGDPIPMDHLVVTYEFIDGLTWSDGTPVSRVDYQLAYEILCNPKAAGEYNYVWSSCGWISSVDFTSDTSYTVTYVPGYRDPEYFLPPIGRQPAHRLTEDGRRLADVPAKDWQWLDAVNKNPIGIGPYVLQSWEYGKQMTFTANPYYFGKPPATPTIVIKFIPQAEIESYLLRGAIDIADSTSFWMGDLSPAVLQAQSEEKIKLYFAPNMIYEQLDFRLTVK